MSDIVLATHGLSRSYGKSAALDQASLTVRKGDIYGLWAATEQVRRR